MRQQIAAVPTYGHVDLVDRSHNEIKGLIGYSGMVAYEILRPQIEGRAPITKVLITGGETNPKFPGISEAETCAPMLTGMLQLLIAEHDEQGIVLDMPTIYLEKKALFSITNLRNALYDIGDEIGDSQEDGVDILYICDTNHDEVPAGHWKQQAEEVLEDKAQFITFKLVTCVRPYDKHLFNNGWLQMLHSWMLKRKKYRERKINATVRPDAGARGRLGQLSSLLRRH